MEKLKLFIDVDGVIFNINKKAIDIANKEFGTNYDFTLNTSWWWNDYTTETGKGDRKYFEELLDRDGFFRSADIIDTAQIRINELHNLGHKIYFLSSPHWTSKTFMCDRVEFLKEVFEWFDPSEHLILTSKKGLVDDYNTLVIDDYPHNLSQFKKALKICYGQKYNEDYSGIRVNGWDELKCLIDLIEERENN